MWRYSVWVATSIHIARGPVPSLQANADTDSYQNGSVESRLIPPKWVIYSSQNEISIHTNHQAISGFFCMNSCFRRCCNKKAACANESGAAFLSHIAFLVLVDLGTRISPSLTCERGWLGCWKEPLIGRDSQAKELFQKNSAKQIYSHVCPPYQNPFCRFRMPKLDRAFQEAGMFGMQNPNSCVLVSVMVQ